MMKQELYKIIPRKFLKDFIEGNLYMNTLNFFRGEGKNSAQGDWQEGVCGTINKNQLRQMGKFFTDEELSILKSDTVTLLSDFYAVNNIFCMYNLMLDEENRIVYKPDEKLKRFNNTDSDSLAVRITDKEKFIKKIEEALETALSQQEIEYGVYGDVKYSSAWVNAESMGERSVFNKEPDYAYQNEWRLCVLKMLHSDSPFILKIGNIKEITEVYDIDTFINNPESIYKGFSVKNDTVSASPEIYRVIGSLDSAHHLLYSYMNTREKLKRSDTAQADWHYSQYLILNGKRQEACEFLYDKLLEYKDFEHLDLFVQNRLPDNWQQAADAYMKLLNEYPDLVASDPDRFFFGLHSILMHNHQVIDDAKIILLSRTKYKFGDDMVILTDILVALGFYDRVISEYHKMKKNCQDPVIIYYLAVSNAFILNFSKARDYISEYMSYFSHSPKVVESTEKINAIIECFNEEKPIDYKKDVIACPDDFKFDVEALADKISIMNMEPLYYLYKNGRIDILKTCRSVIVSPAAVADMCDLYIDSGDETLYGIIVFLKSLKNLKVISPGVLTFLEFRDKYPEPDNRVIMDFALKKELSDDLENYKQDNNNLIE